MNRFVPFCGWMAFVLGFAALFSYIVAPEKINLVWTLALVALGNLIFVLAVDWRQIKSAMRSRTALFGFNTTVLVLVVLGLLIFLNLIAYRHKHRVDLTEQGIYSLAPQTKKIVSHLPREVKLTAFFQMEAPQKSDFENLMDGYLELSGKIKLDFVDPDKSPAITKQYGVTTYGTVVLESGKQETKVTQPTEENLTNALLKVTRDETKTLYFLTGHGEKSIGAMDKEGYASVKAALEKDQFTVKELLLMQTGEIPGDASVLIIAGPTKPLLPKELELIKHYLGEGGALFALLDPQTDFGLNGLLTQWGIELDNDIVIDPLSRLFGGDFAAPVINRYTMHDITKNFTLATILPVVRSVRAIPAAGVETVELLKTGDNSWGEMQVSSDKVKFDEGTDLKGPLSVAVVATRTLKNSGSGSDSGKAENNGEANDNGAGEEQGGEKRQASLVVIGDSDFASNNYFKFSGNGDLFLNTTSWLAEEDDLISIRSKERTSSPIQLTRASGNLIFILGVIVFPGLVVISGIRVWWRRRSL